MFIETIFESEFVEFFYRNFSEKYLLTIQRIKIFLLRIFSDYR
jgi:hypothetical protein